MKIAIITRGRMGNVRTLESIPAEWREHTHIVCPNEEVASHASRYRDIKIIAEGGTLNYSEKFHNIVNGVYPALGRRILIMDDDLRFSARARVGTSLVKASFHDIDAGLRQLSIMLDSYPLVGLHPRAMGNNAPRGIKEIARINAMQGVNLDMIGPVKLDYWPILADMVLNLSLLTRGQKTAIWCELFWDQMGSSNAPGGCSLHRTPEQQVDAVHGLAKMFHPHVTIKEKEVKKGWFGGKRTDFVIQWKKAYTNGTKHD